MANLENLKPFKKGKSGNPKGKEPGTKNRATILRKWIEISAKITDPETQKISVGTLEDKVALALLKKAGDGDVAAIKEINDTLYGKIKEQLDLSGTVTLPITGIKIVKDGADS